MLQQQTMANVRFLICALLILAMTVDGQIIGMQLQLLIFYV